MQIHVVIAYGGEYEDRWSKNLKGFLTAERAAAFIEEEKASDQAFQALEKQLRDHCHAWFDAQGPEPDFGEYERPPRLPSDNKLITPEMRAERDHINAENQARIDKRNEFYNERSDRWLIEREQFLKLIGVEDITKFSTTGQSYFEPEGYRVDLIEVEE
jgi:hypothetical protein